MPFLPLSPHGSVAQGLKTHIMPKVGDYLAFGPIFFSEMVDKREKLVCTELA